ncbi:MAG: hypothetical protein AAB451_04175 [Patescibacteria group bacterium]
MARYYWNDSGRGIPEIVYPLPVLPQGKDDICGFPTHGPGIDSFRLDDRSVVCINGARGEWGKIKKSLVVPYKESMENSPDDFEVEIEDGLWICSPKWLTEKYEAALEKISRRNRQIENLRDQLATAKQRLI